MFRFTPELSLFPYTTLFRSAKSRASSNVLQSLQSGPLGHVRVSNGSSPSTRYCPLGACVCIIHLTPAPQSCLLHSVDRKSTRLNSSHLGISYAVFCLKKKKF